MEKGEKREQLLQIVLHGCAGEEECVVRFDFAESLCITQQGGGNKEALRVAVLNAMSLIENQEVVRVVCDEVSVVVHRISFKQSISTIEAVAYHHVVKKMEKADEAATASSGLPLNRTTLAPLHHVSISLFQLYSRLVGTTIKHCSEFWEGCMSCR